MYQTQQVPLSRLNESVAGRTQVFNSKDHQLIPEGQWGSQYGMERERECCLSSAVHFRPSWENHLFRLHSE